SQKRAEEAQPVSQAGLKTPHPRTHERGASGPASPAPGEGVSRVAPDRRPYLKAATLRFTLLNSRNAAPPSASSTPKTINRATISGTTEVRTLVNEVQAPTRVSATPIIAVIRKSSPADDSK